MLDKENAHARTGIFMIDASKGFIKDGPKNRLRAQDIHKIVDVFTSQIELAALLAHGAGGEIASPANDYNLNIPRYIDSSEPEDLHDLDAHLQRRHPGPRRRRAGELLAGLSHTAPETLPGQRPRGLSGPVRAGEPASGDPMGA